jgi:hypothetical protein
MKEQEEAYHYCLGLSEQIICLVLVYSKWIGFAAIEGAERESRLMCKKDYGYSSRIKLIQILSSICIPCLLRFYYYSLLQLALFCPFPAKL